MANPQVSINIFDLITSICDEFRREWKSGRRPLIEDYLAKIPENARETLFRNLLPADVRYRERNGEKPQPDDYLERFAQFQRVIGDTFNFSTSMELSAVEKTTNAGAMDPSVEAEIPVAGRIGEYELVRELGRGGFGVVYEALHTVRRNRVALKTLPTGHSGQEAIADRLHKFRREFRSLAEINHPNLVGMQTLEVDGSQWFFTMDLIAGDDFLTYVRPNGELHEKRLRKVMQQLVGGIIALHERRILHRDLKPSNVLVAENGRVFILDFGLVAKLEEAGNRTVSMPTLSFAGTPRYAAPEQAQGERTAATDWYAVGVMLFEALTGEPPFTGNAVEMLVAKQTKNAPTLGGRETLPPDLAVLVDGLLRRDPMERLNAAEIRTILGELDISLSHDSTESASSEASPVSESDRSDTLLIGRESQLAALAQAFQELQQNRQPAAVFIRGRSGEGKTALADKFLASIEHNSNVPVLAGRCYDRESVPFKAVECLIDALVRFLRHRTDGQLTSLLPRDIELLAQLFPTLGRVDAIAARATGIGLQIDERQLRNRAFYALGELLVNMTSDQPVVLFIDDLQWADRDSAGVLFNLLSPPAAPQVLLMGSYRSDEAKESAFLQEWDALMSRDDTAIRQHRVTVEPLSESECLKLLSLHVGIPPEQLREQVDRLFRDTRGNPYFLEQLIDSFDPETGRFNPVPLHTIIQQRLQRLPDDSTALLERIAVAGQAVDLDEVSEVAGFADPAYATVTRMRSERLVRLIGSDDAQRVDTYHDKIRETVLEQMDDRVRRSLHRDFAETIQKRHHVSATDSDVVSERVFDLAHHFTEANDPRAFEYQLAAGRAALETYAMAPALAHLQKAHALQPRGLDGPTEYELNFLLARAQWGCDALDPAIQSFNTALKFAQTNLQRAEARYALAQIALTRSDFSGTFELLRYAFAELGDRLPKTSIGKLASCVAESFLHLIPVRILFRSRSQDELMLLSRMYASCTYMAGGVDIACFPLALVRALLVARGVSDQRVKCVTYANAASMLRFVGVPILPGLLMKAVKQGALRLEDNLHSGRLEYYCGIYAYAQGRLNQAQADLEAAAAGLARIGDPEERMSQHFLWHVWSVRGVASRVLLHASAEESIARLSNDELFLSYSFYGQAEALAHQGKTKEAHKLAERAIATLTKFNATFVCMAHMQLARVQIQAGEYRDARTSLSKSIKDIPKLRFFDITVPTFFLYVESVLATNWIRSPSAITSGDLLKARCFAFFARAAGWLFPNQKPPAWRVSGRLAAAKGRTRRAIRCFDKAIAAGDKIGARYEQARSFIDKSTLDYVDAETDRQHGISMLEELGCVLPDAELEYLDVDRESHYARSAAARETSLPE